MFKFNNWKSTILALTLLSFATVGCSSGASQATPVEVEDTTFKISGSGSTTAVLAAIKPAFEADTSGMRLEILPGSGSGGGVEGVVAGKLDIAAMARPPKDDEKVEFVELGQAGEGIITHPEVGVTNITSAQVGEIFSGQVLNWSEVGGADLPIILYVRDKDDSGTKALRSAYLGETPFSETVARVLTSQSEMLTAVEGTPGSVGIATWPTALAKATKVSALIIDDVAPNDVSYPMVSPLGIGYLADRQADVQPLIDWIQSEQGQQALQELAIIIGEAGKTH